MNYMLTGARHCGKSTVIKNTVRALGLHVSGFCTSLDVNAQTGERILLMHRAETPPETDLAHRVAVFSNGSWQALPERFDALGGRFLQEVDGTVDLIVIDELGYLEEDAKSFQQAVHRALDRDVPVLGVIREGFPGWTESIAVRDDVCMITVTEYTRDALPEKLAALIRLTQNEMGTN